jgi:hypothetical protein
MFNEVLVGTQNQVSDGLVTKARGGRQGDQIVSELHGALLRADLPRATSSRSATQGERDDDCGPRDDLYRPGGRVTRLAPATTWSSTSSPRAVRGRCGRHVGIIGRGGQHCGFADHARTANSAAARPSPRQRLARPFPAPILMVTFGSVGSLATTGYGVQPGIVVDLEGSLIMPARLLRGLGYVDRDKPRASSLLVLVGRSADLSTQQFLTRAGGREAPSP